MKTLPENKRRLPIDFGDCASLPPWVVDFGSFRDWSISDSFPDAGSISFCGDRIWVDVSMEKYAHNQIKGKIATTLSLLIEEDDLGEYVYDRMRLIHHEALLSTEPDGMFFFHQTRQSGKVQLTEGEDSLEIIGTPDMTLEVVSSTSVKKDTKLLMDLYWQAEIPEYWLVDSRVEFPELAIYRRTSHKYTLVRKQEDWTKSIIFGKSFRLVTEKGKQGNIIYRLEMR